MEKFDIFQDIAQRTGGDIYIGVVGPVRTGKSTLIKRFMELLVLPNIDDPNERERALDALPQSGTGRTVTTTEPKFVPDEGVDIVIKENIRLRVRMVDCVGFTVPGAQGYEDEDGPRLLQTPWYEEPIPFGEAAEVGTRKVIAEHSTVGLVVTTDGTITEIPRENYVEAEERVIAEIKAIGKPFVLVLNSAIPEAQETLELAAELQEKFDVPVVPTNCSQLTEDDIFAVMEQLLLEFPVKEVNVSLPDWVEVLESGHWLKDDFERAVSETVQQVRRLRDVAKAVDALGQYEFVEESFLSAMDLGSGVAVIGLRAPEHLYWKVLSDMTGVELAGEGDLLKLMKELVFAKREYDKVAMALVEVRENGYGMVPPSLSDLEFDEPELIRQGNRFGVRLKARAPSLHFIRVDVETEVTPVIGTEKQSEELVRYLMEQFEDDPKKIWESDIFGKSLNDLLREGIQNKLYRMPENAQEKLQETLQRIVNEGSGGLICIII